MFFRWPEDLHDASKLFLLVLARKDGVTGEELCKDTAETPHVDSQAIAHTQYDFWRTIEARLDVSVDLLVLETARSKVDDLDLRVQWMREQNVLRLQIAVDHPLTLQQNQRAQHLLAETADKTRGKALELVCLDELVQIHAKKLGRYAKMPTEVEALRKVDHTMLVVGILVNKISKVADRDAVNVPIRAAFARC